MADPAVTPASPVESGSWNAVESTPNSLPVTRTTTNASAATSLKPPVASSSAQPPQRPGHWKQQSDEAATRMKRQLSKGDTLSVEEAVRQFRLMEAIRSGDTAQLSLVLPAHSSTTVVAQKSPGASPTSTTGSLATVTPASVSASGQPTFVGSYGTPVHLAAAFGPKNVVQYLLNLHNPQWSVNVRDQHGNTALHLAARAGRAAVMEMLLKEEDIDCTLKNNDNKDVKEIAADSVKMLIEQYRLQYVQQKTLQMHQFASQSDLFSLQQLFSTHRALTLIDINAPDPITGEPILHKAVEKSNVEMVTWCLKMKADPLTRDKRGRLAMELAKQDKIKQLLKGVLSQISFAAPTNPTVKMQGVLYKWTNYASGYKKRWFVLEDGVLSYYKGHEDVPVSCRGSLSLQVAKLWIDATDKSRFDILAPNNVRFHLRAEHPTEAKRWVIALTEAKQWLQDNTEFQNRVQMHQQIMAGKQLSSEVSNSDYDTKSERSTLLNQPVSPIMREESTLSIDDDSSDVDEEEVSITSVQYTEAVHSSINSALAGIHYQMELFATSIRMTSINSDSATSHNLALIETFSKSASAIQKTLRDIVKQVEQRESTWKKRLEKEQELKRVWEENLRALAKEHDELQTKASMQMSALERASRIGLHSATSGNGELNAASDDEEDEFFDAVDIYREKTMTMERSHASPGGKEMPDSLITTACIGYPAVQPDGFRKLLPLATGEEPVKNEISLWSVLKNNIGKDLSKIALPVFFNEPLSMLQRLCEDMEYSQLLDIAVSRDDPLERIQFVAAFAMSNYSSTLGRTGKPFNPLLGETFEYVRKDRGFRYVSEQVSHHPPISACHCESDGYIYWAQAHIKNKFWGKSLEIFPLGGCHLILKKTNEHFSWRKVTTSVNNLIYGKLWIDHYGDMIVTNHSTGDQCTITFKPAGWRGKGQYEISGKVNPAGKDPITHEISGHWNDRIVSKPVSQDGQKHTPTVLWKRDPLAADAEKMFNFTEFAATLNDLHDSLKPVLCITDSRLRPDQRAMEEGRFDEADRSKVLLEDRQRKTRAIRNENGIEWAPAWFYQDVEDDTGEPHWVYKGGYWESREKKTWTTESLDIFGLQDKPEPEVTK